MEKEIVKITIDDEIYPQKLRDIKDPPQQLYCIGRTELLNYQSIAVVGTRRSSPYGRWAAFEIAKRIAAAGVCVVSGMAEGIDSRAHWGALDRYAGDGIRGNTIAVLGTGVDVCFPYSNEKLYRIIAETGLIISEYEPGTPGLRHHFPSRNRIISGLSRSVIVVEGALKSGSMITANLALEQGRDVFAVPGNIDQPNSVGVNKLIFDGAFPIMDLDKLNETLGIQSSAKASALAGLSATEKKIVTIIHENPGLSAEYVALKMDSALHEILPVIGIMELQDIIRREGNGLFIKS